MPTLGAVLEEEEAAAPITPETLTEIKNEDMQQAVVERFKVKTRTSALRSIVNQRKRSPYWRPADEEC